MRHAANGQLTATFKVVLDLDGAAALVRECGWDVTDVTNLRDAALRRSSLELPRGGNGPTTYQGFVDDLRAGCYKGNVIVADDPTTFHLPDVLQ